MRITTSMVQRNILADLNRISTQLARTQTKASSGREITRPSDDPFKASQALGLRSSIDANKQYIRNIEDAQGWMEATESAFDALTTFVRRARDLVLEGATDTSDDVSREAIASEIDQIIQGVKETANASYGDRYILSGTATSVAPYLMGADDTYQGDLGGLDPATPGIVREIGPGVTMSINAVGVEVLGDGSDGKLLNILRDISAHLRSDDGDALRDSDLGALDSTLNDIIALRARNGSQSNRLESAHARIDQISEALTTQLSLTEDADIAKTMIDFNSQYAAYQAALRSGASIVQASLMDFLR